MDRRAFLTLPLAALPVKASSAPRACILIWQAGGCSHLDTFDMKPSAPRHIRGEFRPIRTTAPDIEICEHLPRTARRAHRLTIVRSLCSNETNHERARWVSPVSIPVSTTGSLGGQCENAVRRIQAGERLVVVTHHGYDTHSGNFEIMRTRILPEFDQAFPALLDQLDRSGLLDTTLVMVTGEFGRSPRINAQAGRDHHARAWSALLAGGGLPGGRIIGATDETGAEVVSAPVPAEKFFVPAASLRRV